MICWLADDNKKVDARDSHRIDTLSTTISRARRFLRIAGITRIANITGLDRLGIPVTAVYRPNSRAVSVSLGKGMSLDAAIASGVMESLEGYHGEHTDLEQRTTSCRDLLDPYVDWSNLPMHPNSTFDEETSIPWVCGHELFAERRCWVPFELVHTDYRVPAPAGHGFFVASSNGLASGNSPLEAVLHGIYEIVERDGTARWDQESEAERNARRISLDSITDSKSLDVIERFHVAGLRVGVWNTTTIVGIPAFLVWLVDPSVPEARTAAVIGAGCHLDRAIALRRALTEAAQARLTIISGARDDLLAESFSTSCDASIAAQASWLSVLEQPGSFDYTRIPSWQHDTLNDDLKLVLHNLSACHIEQVVYVDLTKKEISIPVFRTVIPGLKIPND